MMTQRFSSANMYSELASVKEITFLLSCYLFPTIFLKDI